MFSQEKIPGNGAPDGTREGARIGEVMGDKRLDRIRHALSAMGPSLWTAFPELVYEPCREISLDEKAASDDAVVPSELCRLNEGMDNS